MKFLKPLTITLLICGSTISSFSQNVGEIFTTYKTKAKVAGEWSDWSPTYVENTVFNIDRTANEVTVINTTLTKYKIFKTPTLEYTPEGNIPYYSYPCKDGNGKLIMVNVFYNLSRSNVTSAMVISSNKITAFEL